MRYAALLVLALTPTAHAADVEKFVSFNHESHIARGCPRHCGQSERSVNSLMGGGTITAGRKRAWEIDLAHGLISINNRKTDTTSSFSARFYPGRLRRE